MKKVSICIPYLKESGKDECVKYALENAGIKCDIEVLTEFDEKRTGCPATLKRLVDQATGEYIVFLADDCKPKANWLRNALNYCEIFPNGVGVVGMNVGINRESAGHFIAHRRMLDLLDGEFYHTGYFHSFCDDELTDRAKELGRFVYASDSEIEHDFTLTDTKKELYKSEIFIIDQRLYLERKLERSGPAVAIAVPLTQDMVDSAFFYSFQYLRKPAFWTFLHPKFSYHTGDMAQQRNDLCRMALNSNCTHILMMDTDQVYHDSDTIHRLLAHGKDFVGAKVHRRWPPYEAILSRGGEHVPDEEIDKGGLVPVDATGAGCILIKTTALLDIGFPWFETVIDANGRVTQGEDINFCHKMKAAGKELFVDCDINIGHLTKFQIDGDFHHLYKKLTQPKR